MVVTVEKLENRSSTLLFSPLKPPFSVCNIVSYLWGFLEVKRKARQPHPLPTDYPQISTNIHRLSPTPVNNRN
jgi:hypothetical protein